MRHSALLVLVFSLLACSRAQPTSSNVIDSERVQTDAPVDPNQPPPVEPAPAGCVVQASIPTQASPGSHVVIEVRPSPPIEYYGGPNPPGMSIELTKPDGEVHTTRVELLSQPVCAYCLPTKDSAGCEHDCRWEPFAGDYYRIDGDQLPAAGEYRVSLRLENYACALEGGEAVLTVTPSG